MATKLNNQNNSGSLTILHLFLMILGVFFALWTSFISLLVAFILVLLTRFLYTYDYTCSSCGGRVGKDGVKCVSCGEKLI